MIRVSLRRICSIVLATFIIAPDIGAIYRVNNEVTIMYAILATIFFLLGLKNKKINIKFNKVLMLMCIYIVGSSISTYMFIDQNQGFLGILCSIAYIYIAYIFSSLCDRVLFVKYVQKIMILFAYISLISRVIDIDFFGILKKGSIYTSVDPVTGGISAIFEFRHYYGVFLMVTLISLILMPLSKKIINNINIFVIVVNIILTYTRNIWIATSIVLMLLFFKYYRFKITETGVMLVALSLALCVICFFIFRNQIDGIFASISKRIDEITNAKNTYGGIGGVRGYTFTYGSRFILDNWREYLLFGGGQGFAILWLVANPYGQWKEWTSAIDVQYVSTFMNSGLIGIISLIWIILIAIKMYIKQSDGKKTIFSLSIIGISIAIIFFDIIGIPNSVFALWNVCLCFLDKDCVVRES
ncbi:O-antigen ligase family protein [Ligilactobacillus agilis]|uniref:O-antigen ligase family protein n=1 Tax=Ligilactobacillus agilis TaxID=1601 RepID=UPI001867CC76|nr:O-antigen ligase family protein [Ligilactobacillus agilis]